MFHHHCDLSECNFRTIVKKSEELIGWFPKTFTEKMNWIQQELSFRHTSRFRGSHPRRVAQGEK